MDSARQRLLALALLISLGLVIILARVAGLALSGERVSRQSHATVRGTIKERRGVSLAVTEEASTIAASPRDVIDAEFTAARLERLIGVPRDRIVSRLEGQAERLHVPLARQVDNYVADRVMELRLPGVHRTREFRRVYPFGTLAANLIGFTGRDSSRALAGLEMAFNRPLVRDTGRGTGPVLHLTLDALIQRQLEAELDKAMATSGSRRSVGIVMRVDTGELLAMAVRPTYDPNEYFRGRPFARTNWAARFNYEPGSTMKVFMAAMLLNEQAVSHRERFRCNGSIAFGETVVHCKVRDRVRAHGSLTLRDILRKSCNVGIIAAMQRIAPEKIHNYLQELGFGRRTEAFPESGIETPGYLPPLGSWVPSSRYYVPIGQSFSVTPLQLIRAGASLANGGRLLRPYVAARLTDDTGRVLEETRVESQSNPFQSETNRVVLDMMRAVVERGTGVGARLQGLAVAGKTGTGQKATAAGYVNRYVASFMGFFPAEQPEYAMLILFDEPRGHAGGGSLAAPVFGRVLRAIRPMIDSGVRTVHLNDLELTPPAPPEEPATDRMPNLAGFSARDALQRLPAGVAVRLFGSGYVFRQEPRAGAPLASVEGVQLYLDSN